MNERLLRPANVAAATLLIGGALIVVQPRWAVSIVQLMIVTIAAAAGLHALATHVPSTGWMSPFKWMSPFASKSRTGGARRGSAEMRSIRTKMAGRRQRVPGAPSLPPETLRALKPLIRVALNLDPNLDPKLDPGGDTTPSSTRAALSPRTRAILSTEPLQRPRWYRTLPAAPRRVADVVHDVLDELDALAAGARGPRPADPHNPTAP